MTVIGWAIALSLTFPVWSKILGYIAGFLIVLIEPIVKSRDFIFSISIGVAILMGLPLLIFSQSIEYLKFLGTLLLVASLFFVSVVFLREACLKITKKLTG